MDEIMDSDDKAMLAALIEEEAEIATADDEENLMMMSCLICGCSKGNTAQFYFLSSIYLDFKLCIVCVYKLCFQKIIWL
jgi:hypothetical protein